MKARQAASSANVPIQRDEEATQAADGGERIPPGEVDAEESLQRTSMKRASYTGEIIKNQYQLLAVDRSEIDGRFGISSTGTASPSLRSNEFYDSRAGIFGGFESRGCKGVPELTFDDASGSFEHAIRPERKGGRQYRRPFLKWVELIAYATDAPDERLHAGEPGSASCTTGRVLHAPVLMQTPGIFRMTPPWHLSYLDKLGLDGQLALAALIRDVPTPVGRHLAAVLLQRQEAHVLRPADARLATGRCVTMQLRLLSRDQGIPPVGSFSSRASSQSWATAFDLSALSPGNEHLESSSTGCFPKCRLHPITDEQIKGPAEAVRSCGSSTTT